MNRYEQMEETKIKTSQTSSQIITITRKSFKQK